MKWWQRGRPESAPFRRLLIFLAGIGTAMAITAGVVWAFISAIGAK